MTCTFRDIMTISTRQKAGYSPVVTVGSPIPVRLAVSQFSRLAEFFGHIARGIEWHV